MTASDDRSLAFFRLLEIMATLRGERGCPWDRKQDHRSLVPYLIEEAYEVVDAIEQSPDSSGNGKALKEELGDLLLQVVFHARIAEEEGRFDFHDVARAISDKLVERHPHVFDGLTIESPEALRRMWHDKKMAGRDSALDGVPAALPALQRAAKVSGAAAAAGFEWHRLDQILDKCQEELNEFRAELDARGPQLQPAPASEAMETELGDLLFALVQLARWQRIDPESALRRATGKFMARFRWMEAKLRERRGTAAPLGSGTSIPENWETLWAEAKQAIPG